MQRLRIGLAAYEFRNGDMSFNLSQIERAMTEAQGKVDLLCFGESFLQGFDALTWQYEHDREIAVTRNDPVMRYLKALTARCGVDLLFGYTERDRERLYSSCAVLVDGAMAHNYRRVSIGWKEYDFTDEHYCEGATAAPFLYRGHAIRLALCGDLWAFPERFATDDLLIWPVYVSYTPEDWAENLPEYAAHARSVARETLMVNSLSRDPVSHGGAFHFVDGVIAERLDFDREGILIVEL